MGEWAVSKHMSKDFANNLPCYQTAVDLVLLTTVRTYFCDTQNEHT